MTSLKARISKLKSSAKARNIEVRLMNYEYDNLLKQGCHYCGNSLSNEKGYCLDRVNPKKGYVLSNVVACCKFCNFGKNTMGFDQFLDWVERVHSHTKGVVEQLRVPPAKETEVKYTYQLEKKMHRENVTLGEIFCIKVKKV